MKKKGKIITTHFLIAVAFIILLYYWKCPIKLIFSIPCPTCGMTRAWLSVLRLDFKKAFYFHPLFLLAPPLLFLIFHEKMIKIKKSTRNTIFILVGVVFFVMYIIRCFVYGVDI